MKPIIWLLLFVIVVVLAGCAPVEKSSAKVNEQTNTQSVGQQTAIPASLAKAISGTVTASIALTSVETVTVGSGMIVMTQPEKGITVTNAATGAGTLSNTSTISATAPDTSMDSAALIAHGLEVYHKQYCGVCHELAAAGTRGSFGPSHDHIGATAAQRVKDPNYSGQAKTAAEYIRESIVDPGIYIVPNYAATSHSMPPFTQLNAKDLDALVAFLLSQK